MKIGQSAGKDYAYLLGVFLGDGCVTHTSDGYLVFRLNTIDEDFALATKTALTALTERPINICKHAVKKSKNPNHSLRCGDQELCRKLVNDTESKRIIPAYVAEWSLENRLAFIVGLMDSEGFVASNKSNPTNRRFYMGFKSCDAWVPQFIRLLEGVGLKIGTVQTEAPLKPGYKPPTRFHIKMVSWVAVGCKFSIKRKQGRVDEWNSAGAYERRAKCPRRSTPETARLTASGG